MENLNEELQKSLDEVEQQADTLQALEEEKEQENVEKSTKTEEVENAQAGSVDENVDESSEEETEVEKGLKPDDISDEDEDEETDEKDTKSKKGKKDNKKEAKEEVEEDEEGGDSKEVGKSFTELANENEELSKALEVSDFLSEFTRVHGEAIDNLRDEINKSVETSTQSTTTLAKSFNAIMKSQQKVVNAQQELSKSIDDITQRLEDVEKQPVGRKGSVSVMEKSFDHSAGIESEKQELSKADKLNRLSDLAMKGDNDVTVSDVVSFESGGNIRPEIQHLVEKQ